MLTTEDIKNVKWLQRAKGHCLKIVTEKGDTLRFDGFRETVLLMSVVLVYGFSIARSMKNCLLV